MPDFNPDCDIRDCGREAVDASGFCKIHRVEYLAKLRATNSSPATASEFEQAAKLVTESVPHPDRNPDERKSHIQPEDWSVLDNLLGKPDSASTGKTYTYWLGEILAIIHGDGGHYQSEHGTEKATKDAIKKYHELRAATPTGGDKLYRLLKREELATPQEGDITLGNAMGEYLTFRPVPIAPSGGGQNLNDVRDKTVNAIIGGITPALSNDDQDYLSSQIDWALRQVIWKQGAPSGGGEKWTPEWLREQLRGRVNRFAVVSPDVLSFICRLHDSNLQPQSDDTRRLVELLRGVHTWFMQQSPEKYNGCGLWIDVDEELADHPRENCILNVDSPTFPPEKEEYHQCGCVSCRRAIATMRKETK